MIMTIRSALRPADDAEARWPARLLHEQYDRFFKTLVTGDWHNGAEGDVESSTGYFSLIIIEHPECKEVWDEFANEDTLSSGQLQWMWSGQLAGYYVTREDSAGLIFVTAYDELEDARRAFREMQKHFRNWQER